MKNLKSNISNFNLDKYLIAAGFIGPIIFFLTVYFIFPLFYPGYDILNQTISELGAANSPIKTLTNVFGFSLFGILLMIFSYGVFRSKELNDLGKLSALLFFITGVMMYLVGIFYGSSINGVYSILDTLHVITANYQFPVLAAGFIIFALSVTNHPRLRFLTPIVLGLGILTLILAYFFFFTHNLPYQGIFQRAAIGLPYIIIAIIAFSMYKLQK